MNPEIWNKISRRDTDFMESMVPESFVRDLTIEGHTRVRAYVAEIEIPQESNPDEIVAWIYQGRIETVDEQGKIRMAYTERYHAGKVTPESPNPDEGRKISVLRANATILNRLRGIQILIPGLRGDLTTESGEKTFSDEETEEIRQEAIKNGGFFILESEGLADL